MALGARLVADDQTQLSRASAAVDGAFDVIASPAPRLSGFIEARGVGLLQVDPLEAASLRWVVELRPPGRAAGDRLPLHPPQFTLTDGNSVMFEFEADGIYADNPYKGHNAIAFEVKDGKVVSFREYFGDLGQ